MQSTHLSILFIHLTVVSFHVHSTERSGVSAGIIQFHHLQVLILTPSRFSRNGSRFPPVFPLCFRASPHAMFTTNEQEENAHRDIAASKAGAIQRQRRASDPKRTKSVFFFLNVWKIGRKKQRDSFFCWIVFDVINRDGNHHVNQWLWWFAGV